MRLCPWHINSNPLYSDLRQGNFITDHLIWPDLWFGQANNVTPILWKNYEELFASRPFLKPLSGSYLPLEVFYLTKRIGPGIWRVFSTSFHFFANPGRLKVPLMYEWQFNINSHREVGKWKLRVSSIVQIFVTLQCAEVTDHEVSRTLICIYVFLSILFVDRHRLCCKSLPYIPPSLLRDFWSAIKSLPLSMLHNG